MNCPEWLPVEGKKFWKRHAKRLENLGLLTDADVDSFAFYCQIYSLLRGCKPDTDAKEAIRFVGLIKQLQAMGKQFGFFAKDRIKNKLDNTKEVPDEFGI